jgi:hypothetical protein
VDLEGEVVWITTRQLRPGTTREDFSRAWRPGTFPEGMLRAYECWSDESSEVVGISVWESAEARDRYRLSNVESERRRAMAPFIVNERSGVYSARELRIPRD